MFRFRCNWQLVLLRVFAAVGVLGYQATQKQQADHVGKYLQAIEHITPGPKLRRLSLSATKGISRQYNHR